MGKRGFLIATSAGFAAAAAMPGAQAADMPVKAQRYYEPSASWAGWYIGAHAGAAWHQTSANVLDQDSEEFPFGSTFSKTGFIGGGQIGYNWQHGNFVFGLEGDISGLTGKNSLFIPPNPNRDPSEYGFSSQIRWLSTVRTRFGLAVGDTMVYATGGVAFAGVKTSEVIQGFGSYSQSKTKVGWAIGGGVEHMLSRNWTIGLEGLFVDLGSTKIQSSGPDASNNKSTKFNNQAVIGRVKLNYKF
jgi:outer membrane immunogenic protein